MTHHANRAVAEQMRKKLEARKGVPHFLDERVGGYYVVTRLPTKTNKPVVSEDHDYGSSVLKTATEDLAELEKALIDIAGKKPINASEHKAPFYTKYVHIDGTPAYSDPYPGCDYTIIVGMFSNSSDKFVCFYGPNEKKHWISKDNIAKVWPQAQNWKSHHEIFMKIPKIVMKKNKLESFVCILGPELSKEWGMNDKA